MTFYSQFSRHLSQTWPGLILTEVGIVINGHCLIRPRERSSLGLPKAYIGLTNVPKIPPLLSIFDFDACYEGSTGGQIGVEFNQKSTGDVGFFPALLLADQSEAENANFLVI